jgi:hypothetical protein
MSETVSLGGRPFALRPLKLGELRHVLDALDGMAGKSGGGLIEAAAQLVAAGLEPGQPGLTAAAVLDLEATVADLNAAVAAILRVAGLNPVGEAAPVASPAISGTASGSSSAPSTAPSPPAAATDTATSTA